MKKLISLCICICFIFATTSCSKQWCDKSYDKANNAAKYLSTRWNCKQEAKMAADLRAPVEKTLCRDNPYINDDKLGASIICSAVIQALAITGAVVASKRYECEFTKVYKDLSLPGIFCNALISF